MGTPRDSRTVSDLTVARAEAVRRRALRMMNANPVAVGAVSDEQAAPSFEDLVRAKRDAKEAQARAVWNASGLEQVARQSAQAAPSAEVSGALALGPNLYRKLGGDVQHPMLPEKGSPGWVALEAAGLLPFGRPIRAGAAGVKRLSRVGRGAKVAEEVVKEAPLPEGAEKIVEALPKAKKLYQEQRELRRVELGKRAAKVEEAMMTAEGVEGLHAGLRALKGELPRLTWEGHTQLDQAAVTGLFRHLKTFEEFQTFEKVRAMKGLKKLLGGGRGPTPSEIELLERALGPDVLGQLQSVPRRTLKELALDVLNIPRAMRSSVDVSGLFRQALVLGARHPVIWGRDVPVAFKALASEKYYVERMEELVSRPTFEKMVEGGVRFTDLGQVAGREEAFMSNLAEEIPWLGKVVRASSRSYTGFLNVFRADAFDHYLRMVETGGKYAPDDPKLLKSIGEWVSTGTGRGTIKSLEDNMVALNFGLFSPRLIASRVQLLNPAFYARLHPFARQQALRGMAQLLGGISLTLWIAKLNGAEVVMDPRSSDFGKIKLGDTRVDIAGGFQQYLVWASRFIKGETVSSTTGKVTELEGGFGKKSRAQITWDFIENKAAPVPGLGIDAMKGKNFAGDEFDPLKETGRIFLPLNLENTYEGYTEGGPAMGAASLLLGGVGFGTQTYKGKGVDKRKRILSLAARDNWTLPDLNEFLKKHKLKEASAQDLARAEREALKLDVQVAK